MSSHPEYIKIRYYQDLEPDVVVNIAFAEKRKTFTQYVITRMGKRRPGFEIELKKVVE